MSRREPAAWGELAGLLEVRPLSTPLPAPTYTGHFASPFSAPFGMTLEVLRREVRHLEPSRVILEADFRPQDLRMDGMPRANAQPGSEGVVLTLLGVPPERSMLPDLRYPCSTFRRWDANLHAIALALEALRKVDRYGVTKRGEQYRGFGQLPSPDAARVQRGRDLIRQYGSARAALMATHPDRGGSHEDAAAVNAAMDAARETARARTALAS